MDDTICRGLSAALKLAKASTDGEKITSLLQGNSVTNWDKTSLGWLKVLMGHTDSVLCLQYDERAIVTGSSESIAPVSYVNGM